MNNKTENSSESVMSKKQWALFFAGLILLITGLSIISFYGYRKICREIQIQRLFRDNAVVEIPMLDIKAPILEGTDKDVLSKAAGHFEDSGEIGLGNYCIAGHSSIIYKEYFNELKKIKIGDEIILYDKSKRTYRYITDSVKIVDPNETWVLNEFGDNRITIITCTDDGSQRLVVVGKLLTENDK